MANNDLGTRFSNNIYATKQDVMQAMKVQIIDSIWNKILDYRSNFTMILGLKDIKGSNYNVCLTPTIAERVNQIERKFLRAMINYNKLGKEGKKEFKEKSLLSILRSVANKYKINISDDEINKIIYDDISDLSLEARILYSYLNSLKSIESNFSYDINDQFFGLVYSSLLGTDNLTEFYRTNEISSNISKTVINRLYLGVPTNAIETLMNSLFMFLENNNVPLVVKAACSFYFTYYVKPFETFSEEISVLLFKNIFAHNDIGEVALYFNAENLLLNKEELESFILESQKTGDLTYILNYILKNMESGIEVFLDRLVKAKRDEIVDETYSLDVSKVETSKNVVEEVKQSEETVTIQQNSNSPVSYNKTIAFTSIPAGLSEEEASKFETHLLEIYPDLSRSQAYFYARHCTLGSKYTIAQFKKEIGCAYETARTSMDSLVYFGFYRKEPLKNKYVYMPVKKN